MLRRFFRDSAIYGISGVLSRGVALLLLPFYTRVFSPTDYGILDILLIVAALVNLTVALEISQGVARYFPDAQGAEERVGYASTALWFTVLAYTAFLVAVFGFAERLSLWILTSAGFADLVRVAAVAICANGVFYLLQNQLRWQLRAHAFAVASLAYTVVSAAVTVWLILRLDLGVSAFFYGQAAGAVIGSVIAWWASRESIRFRVDLAKCREMLRFAAPLVPSGIAVFISLYIDRMAISRLMTVADVGVYGVGYRLASIAGLLLLGFQSALGPLVYQHYKEPGTPLQLARIFRVFLAFVLPVALGLALFAPELIHLLAPPAYQRAAAVVPLMVLGVVLFNMYIFAPGLGIAKRTQAIAGINVASAALNTVLNLMLIPLFGLAGAAGATALSAFAAFVLYMGLSQRLYPVPHDWTTIGSAVAVAGGVGVLGATWMSTVAPLTLTVFSVKLLLCAGAAGVLLWLLLGRRELELAYRVAAIRGR